MAKKQKQNISNYNQQRLYLFIKEGKTLSAFFENKEKAKCSPKQEIRTRGTRRRNHRFLP